MTTFEYIESGILELFVYGILNDDEMAEVQNMAEKHPEIKKEIEHIEKAMIHLSGSISPRLSGKNYEEIKARIFGNPVSEPEERIIQVKRSTSWVSYTGWAAAIIFLASGVYQYLESEKISDSIQILEDQKNNLKQEIVNLEFEKNETLSLLKLIRDKDNTIITLGGQEVSPQSYAKIYWNQRDQTVWVDGAGLPTPPNGMVYQVWALKLDPLTPVSIGLLTDFTEEKDKIFQISNVHDADAFGITLEPIGGSEFPTLEQLYTLGKV